MRKLTILTVIALFFALQWSCKKSGPADAVVVVQDTIGRPVAGARVILRQDSVVNPNTGVRADVYAEQVTGSTGEAFFSFKLEAVLNIEVSKDSITENTEYIRLEQNETVRKVVTLK